MEREGTDETRYRLDKGSSSLNPVANVPVNEKLKETARNVLDGHEAELAR